MDSDQLLVGYIIAQTGIIRKFVRRMTRKGPITEAELDFVRQMTEEIAREFEEQARQLLDPRLDKKRAEFRQLLTDAGRMQQERRSRLEDPATPQSSPIRFGLHHASPCLRAHHVADRRRMIWPSTRPTMRNHFHWSYTPLLRQLEIMSQLIVRGMCAGPDGSDHPRKRTNSIDKEYTRFERSI